MRQRPLRDRILVHWDAGEDHQVSNFVDNSHAKNDGGEENLSSSSDAFSVPEKARSSAERARRRRHGTPPNAEKEWYSKTEAARYLGVAEITITRYLDKGTLHAHRLPNPNAEPRQSEYNYGRLRIHKSELDRFLESVDRGPNEPVAQAPASQDNRYGVYNNDNDEVPPTTPTSVEDDELMTRQEAALRLGVSWRTIDRYIKSGVLRLAGYLRCPDTYTRAHVYRSDVEKLLQGDS